jgi:hypothetical protein
MTTRYTAKKGAGGKADLGYQDGEQVSGADIPSCTIEDVDRSVFNLFEKSLNFTVKSNKKPIKVPVIFATGERFALLSRKKPLRDSSSALILPLISIMRTGVEQNAGIGENIPLVIKKKLAPEDAAFQSFVNKQGLLNSDELARPQDIETEDGKSEAGIKLSKQSASSPSISNPQIVNDVNYNIYEVFEIPPVKHYMANYEITFWCQYTQQMNNMLTILMGGYTNNNVPSFRLDTNKGYFFTGFVENALNPDVNFDDFTEEERLVKCSINMKVQAFLVAPRSIGQPSPIRRYVSSPHISFTMHSMKNGVPKANSTETVDSAGLDDHILADMSHELGMPVRQSIAGQDNKVNSSEEISDNLDSLGTTTLNNNIGSMGTVEQIVRVDPVTGERTVVEVRITEQNVKAGETVFRAKGFVTTLDYLIKK